MCLDVPQLQNGRISQEAIAAGEWKRGDELEIVDSGLEQPVESSGPNFKQVDPLLGREGAETTIPTWPFPDRDLAVNGDWLKSDEFANAHQDSEEVTYTAGVDDTALELGKELEDAGDRKRWVDARHVNNSGVCVQREDVGDGFSVEHLENLGVSSRGQHNIADEHINQQIGSGMCQSCFGSREIEAGDVGDQLSRKGKIHSSNQSRIPPHTSVGVHYDRLKTSGPCQGAQSGKRTRECREKEGDEQHTKEGKLWSREVQPNEKGIQQDGDVGVTYQREMEVAVQAVQLGCMLSQRVQERLLRNEEKADSKHDKSLVTVADWGVQAVVSWVLSQQFIGEEISMVAEEDTRDLRGMDGIDVLQRVVSAVNECLTEASAVGIAPPRQALGTIDVLKAINKGSAEGGSVGRHWVLDPVDGTLGFVRGDQYAVALAMVEDGEVVLGVLGCPNFPMRREWLGYHHRYYRLVSKLAPPSPGAWHKGCVMTARKGGGQAWMQPLVFNGRTFNMSQPHQVVSVSEIDDPSDATFCEPVEKANSSHSFTAGLANTLGLRKRPLRVYSMAKYAAIARGDAQIFMKFARAGYKEKIWDHAAGVLIVQEAGGVVTDAGGCPLDFSQGRYLKGLDRGIIASSGKKLHLKIVAAVDASWNCSTL